MGHSGGIKLACFLLNILVAIVGSGCQSDEADKRFYPSEHDEDYDFPKYPFQQYIQVRKSVR